MLPPSQNPNMSQWHIGCTIFALAMYISCCLCSFHLHWLPNANPVCSALSALISSVNYSLMLFTVNQGCSLLTDAMIFGETSKYSVETVDFLQKNVKCMRVEFCRSVTPSPHVRVKGHLGDDSQLLLYYTWQCLFVKWRQQSPTFCKGLNIIRMQAFVRLPTEFDHLLLILLVILMSPLVHWFSDAVSCSVCSELD